MGFVIGIYIHLLYNYYAEKKIRELLNFLKGKTYKKRAIFLVVFIIHAIFII